MADAKEVEKPVGLFVMNDVITEDHHAKAIAFLSGIPCEKYHPITARGKHRIRIGFGRPAKNEKPVPEELKHLLAVMLESLKSEAGPELLAMLNKFDLENYRLTINQYEPGWGLGDHYDTKAGEDAIVIGLTLCPNADTTRRMMFTKGEKDANGKKVTHAVLTRAKSAYVFWKDGYTDWQHGSKANKKQKGLVYSISFRYNC